MRGRLCTGSNCISFVVAFLTVIALFYFIKFALHAVRLVHTAVNEEALSRMADDPEGIWGICAGLPHTYVKGSILFWNFSMLCPGGDTKNYEANGQDSWVIANPNTTFTFLNTFTQN